MAHGGSARSALFGLLAAAQTVRSSHRVERNLLGEVAPEGASFSSGYQTVTIPASASSAILSFWYWPGTDDTSGDFQRVLLLQPTTYALVANVLKVLEDDAGWKQRAYDLTPFQGESLVLYFDVYNDSSAAGDRTWMFLDDVSLQVCTAPTPAPTSTPTPTDTPPPSPVYLPLILR